MSDFYSNVEKALDRIVEGALESLGAWAAKEMKDEIESSGHNDTGRLKDSITWATSEALDRSLVGPAAEEGDVIAQPTTKLTLHIGTADGKAPYVEYGTDAHRTDEQKEEFHQRLLEWCARHGWTSKDGGPLTLSDIYPVLKKIQEEGTDASPFVQPTKDKMEQSGLSPITAMVNKLIGQELNKIPKNTKTVDFKIDIQGGK